MDVIKKVANINRSLTKRVQVKPSDLAEKKMY